MAKDKNTKSNSGNTPEKPVKSKISKTEEYPLSVAVQLFKVNKREISFLTRKHGNNAMNIVSWKEAFVSDDIMFEDITE